MATAIKAIASTCPALQSWPTTCPLLQALAACAVQILQYVLMAVVMFGDHIFPALGVRAPELYQQVKDKKFGVIMGAWLIGGGPVHPLVCLLCPCVDAWPSLTIF